MKISEIENAPENVCEDCGTIAPEGKAGCLKMFEEILTREFSDYRYGKIHRLTVDAYSLQHPDPYMRSGKSFAAHLTGICAALESEDTPFINRAVQKWLSGAPMIEKPERLPEYRGYLTVAYILDAADAEDHTKRVREWAQTTWKAWAEYHDLAKRWISEASAKAA